MYMMGRSGAKRVKALSLPRARTQLEGVVVRRCERATKKTLREKGDCVLVCVCVRERRKKTTHLQVGQAGPSSGCRPQRGYAPSCFPTLDPSEPPPVGRLAR